MVLLSPKIFAEICISLSLKEFPLFYKYVLTSFIACFVIDTPTVAGQYDG